MSDESKVEVQFGAKTTELEAGTKRAESDMAAVAQAVRDAAAAITASTQSINKAWENVGEKMKQSTAQTTAATKQMAEESKGAFAKITEAAQAMQGGVSGVMGEVASALGKFQGLFAGAAAAMGGGAAFKAGVSAYKEQAADAIALSRALGLTAAEANVLNAQLEAANLTKDTYLGGTRAMTRALNTNSDAFKEMGIKTKDSQGDLLPMQQLIENTVASLNQYAAGSDRNAMAQQLLGRSYDDILSLTRLNAAANEEGAEKIKAYHEQLDPAQVKAYRDAMRHLGDAGEGVGLAIGRGAMPAMTELAEWLSQAGPTATEVMMISMDALGDVFDSVKDIVSSMWETISEAMSLITGAVKGSFEVEIPSFGEVVKNVFRIVRVAIISFCSAVQQTFEIIRSTLEWAGSWLMRFNNVAVAAFRLDWNGVKAAWSAGTQQVEKIVAESAARMAKIQKTTYEKIQDALTGDIGTKQAKSATAVQNNGTKHATTLGVKPPKQKNEKEKKDPSNMKEYELELDDMKLVFAQKNEGREMDKAAELAFWEAKLEIVKKGSDDEKTIARKVAQEKIAILREGRKNSIAEEKEAAEETERLRLSLLAIDEENANQQLALGQITKTQLLQQQKVFEDQRYEIQREAQARRIALMRKEDDPAAYMAASAKLLELDRARNLKKLQIDHQLQAQESPIWKGISTSMSSLWDKGISAMMNGTLRWKNALRATWTEMAGMFANTVIKPIVANWAKSLSTMIAQKLGFAATEKAIDTTSAATSMATTGAAATVKVGANAASAASGAASAMASIPYVGPILAIAAMGAMFAAVSAMGSNVKSASGGYDIPSGLNPVTQLHEEEMVLPKGIANPLRKMLGGGEQGTQQDQGQSSQGEQHLHIHATDSKSVERLLFKNQDALAKVMREMSKNGRI
jgi:hypothetical protein